MRILGVWKEPEFERRVCLLPEAVDAVQKLGYRVWVESGAGAGAFRSDEDYEAMGAKVVNREELFQQADILVGIHPLDRSALDAIPDGRILIAAFQARQNRDLIAYVQQRSLTCFSLDLLPRTTRAQAMDILSSMATVAGYKAVLLGASQLAQFMPMFMTAAGTITPAKVLVLGAGVAGLQAIATARRLGAVVHVFDVRAAVKEEVQSLGGKFIEVPGFKEAVAAGGYAVEQDQDYIDRQRQAIHDIAVKSQIIICTAQIPGKTAPILIDADTVQNMQPGSVIVDLAASSGGNCVLTENDKTCLKHGVTIIGNSNLPSTMPIDSSRMYGRNVLNFLKLFKQDQEPIFSFEDDILCSTCIANEGKIISPFLQQQYS
jgi:NAD(P) transhydrogenase subunit alpha